MKYAHKVKHNGVYYPAGAEIPDEPVQGGSDDADRLDALKAEAAALGVDYHPNIGYDKLFERVQAAKQA